MLEGLITSKHLFQYPFIIVTCNCNWTCVSLLSALVPPIITRTQIGSFFCCFCELFSRSRSFIHLRID